MCSQHVLHPATALLKACWWLLFALRIQRTRRKNLHALTLAGPSVSSCAIFLRQDLTFSGTQQSASDVHSAWTLDCALCSQCCPLIVCYRYLCPSVQLRGPLRRGPASLPTFFLPGPLPPSFFLKISVSDYCVCPSFMTVGIVYLLNVPTLAPDIYQVQNKLVFQWMIRRNIVKWKKLSHRQALGDPFTKIKEFLHIICMYLYVHIIMGKKEEVCNLSCFQLPPWSRTRSEPFMACFVYLCVNISFDSGSYIIIKHQY